MTRAQLQRTIWAALLLLIVLVVFLLDVPDAADPLTSPGVVPADSGHPSERPPQPPDRNAPSPAVTPVESAMEDDSLADPVPAESEPPLVLRGVVVHADGAPARDLPVLIRCINGELAGLPRTARTTDDGAFSVPLQAIEPHSVLEFSLRRIEGRRLLSGEEQLHGAREQVRQGVTVRVVLSNEFLESDMVPLRVTGPSGTPVPLSSFLFQWRAPGPRGLWQTREGGAVDGFALLEWPEEMEGTPLLDVFAPRESTGAPLPLASGRWALSVERPLEVLAPLAAGLAVAGTVVDGNGTGVGGAMVAAARPPPIGVDDADARGFAHAILGSAMTDAEGRFEIGSLGDGVFLLLASGGSDLTPGSPVSVRAGDRDVRLTLSVGAAARIRVTGPANVPVSAANVMVLNTGMGEDSLTTTLRLQLERIQRTEGFAIRTAGTTNHEGVAMLAGLPRSGRLALSVTPPRNSGLIPFHRDPWVPVDTPVVLERAHSLAIRVVDGTGQPAAGVALTLTDMDGIFRWGGRSLSDGTALAKDIPPGPLRLLACPPGAPPHLAAEASVSGNDGSVSVQVDARPSLIFRLAGWPKDAPGATLLHRRRPDGDWVTVFNFDRENRTFRVYGLDPKARYEAFVRTMGSGRPAVWHGVDLAADGDSLSCEPGPGLGLVGRLLLPAEYRDAQVAAGPEEGRYGLGNTTPEEDGRFEIVGLPDVRLWIEAAIVTPDGELRRGTWARPGTDLTLDLR